MLNSNWQHALKLAISDPQELLNILELDIGLLPAAQQAAKLFSLRVPRGFVARIEKGNINDPLLRQILPLGAELEEVEGFVEDPLQEQTSNLMSGLLHKYNARVLLTVTGACGVNCRYCFRRHFPYTENNPGTQGWEQALNYIAADSTIKEIILSGGDPLVAPDTYLANLVQKIATIPHVKTLRIHTRMPIVLPERVTQELLNWFTGSRLKPVMVVHCNHANEIDKAVAQAMLSLHKAGVTLLNQAVLLKTVNDSVDSLVKLSQALFEVSVLPYYLHLLDKTRGTAHFEVDESTAKQLVRGMAQQLPGYLVPKLAREEPGAGAKHFIV